MPLVHLVFAVLVILAVAIAWAASPVATIGVVVLLAFATSGYVVGAPKGHGAAGILLGSLLGPVGLVIVAMLAPNPAVRAWREHVGLEPLRRDGR